MDQFMAGWTEGNIHDFVVAMRDPPSSMAYALITRLDSSADLPGMLEKSKHLKQFQRKSQLVGSGLLLSIRQLVAAEQRDPVFFGFDEVWFFPKRDISPKPDALSIGSPPRIRQATIESHVEWLQRNGCSLGLGDGVGLNYCARLRGVSPLIVGLINESLQEQTVQSA